MIKRITLLWVTGLFTIVPYSIYYLLFHAQRDDYALLITLVLFWIFGFWGLVGPLIAACRVHRLFKAIELAGSTEQLREVLLSAESREAAIDLIARENRIPRFLARKLFDRALARLELSAEPAPGFPEE
jgi:hypothetical protein